MHGARGESEEERARKKRKEATHRGEDLTAAMDRAGKLLFVLVVVSSDMEAAMDTKIVGLRRRRGQLAPRPRGTERRRTHSKESRSTLGTGVREGRARLGTCAEEEGQLSSEEGEQSRRDESQDSPAAIRFTAVPAVLPPIQS